MEGFSISESLHRNDTCPCKSGKLYKECHLRYSFNPKEGFFVKPSGGNIAPSFHLEHLAGSSEWIKKPLFIKDSIDDV